MRWKYNQCHKAVQKIAEIGYDNEVKVQILLTKAKKETYD